jgi:CspA family cold shock protein
MSIGERITGRVKWFKDEKGFGFIVRDDGRGDVFVHHTGILGAGFKSLATGDSVEFEVVIGEKGEKAVSVNKI